MKIWTNDPPVCHFSVMVDVPYLIGDLSFLLILLKVFPSTQPGPGQKTDPLTSILIFPSSLFTYIFHCVQTNSVSIFFVLLIDNDTQLHITDPIIHHQIYNSVYMYKQNLKLSDF